MKMYRSRSLLAIGAGFSKSSAYIATATVSNSRWSGLHSIRRLNIGCAFFTGTNEILIGRSESSLLTRPPTRLLSSETATEEKSTKLYIGNLGWDTSNEDLQESFSKFGEPLECYVVFDKNTGESRGFGFVSFASEEEANEAVASMNGVEMDGRRIKVMISRPRSLLDLTNAENPSKIYIGNLSEEVTAERIKDVFSKCGNVDDVTLVSDRDTGLSRGYGFVTFSSPEEASKAVDEFNGFEIDGKEIKVNIYTSRRRKKIPYGSRAQDSYDSFENSRIFVGNIGWDTTSDDLKSVFEEYGSIRDVRVVTDRETGNSRGFGFVTFESSSSVERAIAALDGMELKGREIRVNISTPRKPRFQSSYDAEW